VPEDHKIGDRYVATRSNGESIQWRRLYRPLELKSEEEVLVFLVAHEAFHYLRKTRQVEGRHGEIEADAFALRILEHYREGFNIGVNDGEVAGQTVFHCHFHLIPRRKGDVDDPTGGVRNVMSGKGTYR
jgi:diadenosine tetraphosphate (Ap4A) HIT family hydrolase